jgi:hypothetical protein
MLRVRSQLSIVLPPVGSENGVSCRNLSSVPAEIAFAELNGDGFAGVADLIAFNACIGSNDPDWWATR